MSEVGPDLLGRLLDEHGTALVLYARQWCSSAEDVVQEALICLARQPRIPDRLMPWLYRVVRNGAISAARGARRRHTHETAAAHQAGTWFEEGQDARIDASLAARCLESLPLEQREVIVARLWGGLSFQEIGELVEASSSTAHRRYEAGLQALRERLEPSCPRKTNLTN